MNLNSSIICCLSSGDIYLPFGISLLVSFESTFEDFVILSAILLPIKSSVASAVFFFFFFFDIYSKYLIIKVKFILSSTSNGLLFWFVNHTLMTWNSDLNAF